jgi:hypothetical protein
MCGQLRILALERAAAMGFDWVFVNPVRHPGRSGSISSIADYFELNGALIDPADPRSGEDQPRSVLQAARDRGRAGDGRSGDRSLCRRLAWLGVAQLDHRGTTDPDGMHQYCLGVQQREMVGFQSDWLVEQRKLIGEQVACRIPRKPRHATPSRGDARDGQPLAERR